MTELKAYAPPAARSDVFTVMTYNVGYLSGMSNNQAVAPDPALYAANLKQVERVMQALQPDVVGLQEVDFSSHRSQYVDQLDALAQAGGFAYGAKAVNWDKRYVPFPYWPYEAQFGSILSGQAVLSRHPILSHGRIALERPAATPFYYDAFYLDRLVQTTLIDLGRPVMVMNVHLEAFDQSSRENQARYVRALYEQYRVQYPVLIIGDFNSVPPSASRKTGFPGYPEDDFSEDQTIAILTEASSLKAAFSDHPVEEAHGFTYPSANPLMKLDYVFYDAAHITPVERFVAAETGEASDHLPVLMRFRIK